MPFCDPAADARPNPSGHQSCEPPPVRGGAAGWSAASFASAEHRAFTLSFSALLNMSPTCAVPPDDHWPMPPKSGWLIVADCPHARALHAALLLLPCGS